MAGVLKLAGGILGGAALILLFAKDPAENAFYPLCYFHAWTGLWCPGCGGLRGMHELLHGHLLAALKFNALMVLCLLGWLGYVIKSAVIFRQFRIFPKSLAGRHVWLFVAIVLFFGIARNLPGASRLWLMP
jgi:hypothetical protein